MIQQLGVAGAVDVGDDNHQDNNNKKLHASSSGTHYVTAAC